MKYFLIAGEASGDLHASNLMAVIKEQDTQALKRILYESTYIERRCWQVMTR